MQQNNDVKNKIQPSFNVSFWRARVAVMECGNVITTSSRKKAMFAYYGIEQEEPTSLFDLALENGVSIERMKRVIARETQLCLRAYNIKKNKESCEKTGGDLLEIHLGKEYFNEWMWKIFKVANIQTLGDLLAAYPIKLRELPHFGQYSFLRAENLLKAYGLIDNNES